MRSRGHWLLLVMLLLLSTSVAAQTFTATLSGANEVPPADPDGSGTATITFVGTTVNYTIIVNNITPPIAQHIHQGAAGVNGPIVINLPGTWVGNTLVGSTTAPAATINAIIADPAGFYVNVHTNDFPGGAVRGQLARTGDTPTVSTLGLIAIAISLAIAGMFLVRKL